MTDEKDMYDKKHGDPDATLERDHNLAGLDRDGKYQKPPGEGDAAERQQYKPGEEVRLLTIYCRTVCCFTDTAIKPQ